MRDRPLHVPVLLGGPSVTDGTIPADPTHIAAWTKQTPSGPSQHLAIASKDHSIWLVTLPQKPLPPPNAVPPPPTTPIPSILTTVDTPVATPRPELTSRRLTNRSIPLSPAGRSRAASSASSSMLTASSRRRASAFSPPPPAASLPTATLTTATDSQSHLHTSRSSTELLSQLREQAEPEHPHIGLGLGRRLSVQGKEQHEHESGLTSPRSTTSMESSRFSVVTKFWKDEAPDRSKQVEEFRNEMAVERAMDEQVEGEKEERAEMKMVRDAAKEVDGVGPLSPLSIASTTLASDYEMADSGPSTAMQVSRIFLRGRGSIVALRAFETLGILCVLRNEG